MSLTTRQGSRLENGKTVNKKRSIASQNGHSAALAHRVSNKRSIANHNLILLSILLLLGGLTISLNLLYAKRNYRSAKQKGGIQVYKKDKTGRIRHHAVHKVTLEDLGLEQDDYLMNSGNITYEEAIKGREPLVELLHDAGVTDIAPEVLQRLPLWSTIQDLYGPGPVLYGAETCARFQQSIPPSQRSLGVSGMFNSGSNLLAMYLETNCILPENPASNGGIRWQVPWGKHVLASQKWTNTAANEETTNKTTVLPVVLIRDPYGWMHSMCRRNYGAIWHHSEDHCPNLVPSAEDFMLYAFSGQTVPVSLNFGNGVVEKFPSLAHLWSEWNLSYYSVKDYPRILVRYEDVMFYPKQLTQQICACAGGVPLQEEFAYVVDSAKWGPGHGQEQERTSLITAMMKYGSLERRTSGMTREDLQLAEVALDPELMHVFQYQTPVLDDKR